MKSFFQAISALVFLLFGAAFLFADTITSSRLIIKFDGVHERYARLVAKSAEQSLVRISDALGQTLPDSITVIIAETDERFRELTEGSLPDWSAAVALPGKQIILSPLSGQKIEVEKIIAHEIVHVIINDASVNEPVPRWFHEGCAELFSGAWGFRNELYMVWKVNRRDLMTFDDIQAVFSTNPLDAGLAYDQSLAAVRFLVRRHHRAVLTRILDDMRSGESFPQAFLNATGMLPTEFEDEFLSYLRERYGPGSLFVMAPSTWTFMMALFLVVYFVKRRRSRRKLQEWEREESGQFTPTVMLDEPTDVEEYESLFDDPDYDTYEESYDDQKKIIPFKPRPRRYGGYEND